MITTSGCPIGKNATVGDLDDRGSHKTGPTYPGVGGYQQGRNNRVGLKQNLARKKQSNQLFQKKKHNTYMTWNMRQTYSRSEESEKKSWVSSSTPISPGKIILITLHAEIVDVEIEVVSPSIVPSGNFAELNRTVTCMVLKANDRRTSCPCHDEFRGPRSDYVRQLGKTSKETYAMLVHVHQDRELSMMSGSPLFEKARKVFLTKPVADDR
ncbi:hypothetical protein TNCV_2435291 [Trichonephila clavipes]|nr:hypothetical protein TNCV_2435291 [Trichonephila clavipes]